MSKKVAITGGIGSGKSTILNALRDMDYPVFSCDEIYADIRKSADYLKKLSIIFPTAVSEGRLNTKRLSEIVFDSPEERRKLNELSHPFIMKKLNELMDACDEPLIFAEVPLLFENGFEKHFDSIIVVTRNIDERINAICQRNGLTVAQAWQRISSQFDYDDNANQKYLQTLNAHVVQNDGAKTDLVQTVIKLLKKL